MSKINTTPRLSKPDLALENQLRAMAYQINDMSEGSIVGAYNALTAAPTTGTYRQGDFIRNTAPAINTFSGSVVYGWFCTVSGTPGTWAECSYMANVSGHGISVTAAASAPASGSYLVGDFVRNSAPSVNAFTTSVIFGWLCTVAGSPGTWVACSYLSDVPTATSWTAPTLLNSWTNFGSGYNPTGYRKAPGNIVHLRGLASAGTLTDGTVIFTLPSGYRPSYIEALNVTSDKTGVVINIETNGDIKVYRAASGSGSGNGPGSASGGAGASTYIGIDGITFTAV